MLKAVIQDIKESASIFIFAYWPVHAYAWFLKIPFAQDIAMRACVMLLITNN